MGGPDIAAKLVEALRRTDGKPDLRPVHAIGISATGYFEASDIARDYCTAEHFQGRRVSVTVRFSNGSGCAVVHDGWSDVRGMATRFHLSSGPATDLIAMTLTAFFAPTPETFLDFAIAAKPTPVKRESPCRKLLDLLELKLPLRNPYPGETISPDAGAIRFADQNDYAKLAVSQAATYRRAGELSPRGLSRRPYVHCHCARQDASLGSLQLATRLRRSEHQNHGSGNRPIPAEGSSQSAR